MSTGQKIKHYRNLRGLTQDQLGEGVDVTGNAIRNYEHDFRTPNEELLAKIAKELDISIEALQDYEVDSARSAMEALFRLEEAFGLKPTEEGMLAIDPKAPGAQKLAQAIQSWKGVLDEVEAGNMALAEYELWKASLKA